MATISTTIVSCNSPTNKVDETDVTTFYKGLSSFVQHIPKCNILIIGWDMNSHLGKNGNDKFFCLLNSPNRNGEFIAKFSLVNKLIGLNITFKKKQENAMNLYLPK